MTGAGDIAQLEQGGLNTKSSWSVKTAADNVPEEF